MIYSIWVCTAPFETGAGDGICPAEGWPKGPEATGVAGSLEFELKY